MKTLTLAQAHRVLENCSAVIWGDQQFLTYPGTTDLTGDADNQFLYLSGTDDGGQDYAVMFEEGNNQSVKVVGSFMFLTDNEGEEVQLTILCPEILDAPPKGLATLSSIELAKN